jgi:hypothetical protein
MLWVSFEANLRFSQLANPISLFALRGSAAQSASELVVADLSLSVRTATVVGWPSRPTSRTTIRVSVVGSVAGIPKRKRKSARGTTRPRTLMRLQKATIRREISSHGVRKAADAVDEAASAIVRLVDPAAPAVSPQVALAAQKVIIDVLSINRADKNIILDASEASGCRADEEYRRLRRGRSSADRRIASPANG